jgi:hypothetical protein
MRSVAELILLMIFIENNKNKNYFFIVLKGRMYPIGSIRVLTDLSDTAVIETNSFFLFPYASL